MEICGVTDVVRCGVCGGKERKGRWREGKKPSVCSGRCIGGCVVEGLV